MPPKDPDKHVDHHINLHDSTVEGDINQTINLQHDHKTYNFKGNTKAGAIGDHPTGTYIEQQIINQSPEPKPLRSLPNRNPRFTGREQYLKDLETSLKPTPPHHPKHHRSRWHR
ncbi:MAG: hypothetical protein R2865_10965 [Deinococcales bacterium]